MLSSKLREKALQYLNREIEIEELEDWYVARLPLLLADPDSNESELVASIELGLAELNAGIRDEDDLHRLLEEALQEVTIFEEIAKTNKTEESEIRITTSMSSTTISSEYHRIEETAPFVFVK